MSREIGPFARLYYKPHNKKDLEYLSYMLCNKCGRRLSFKIQEHFKIHNTAILVEPCRCCVKEDKDDDKT